MQAWMALALVWVTALAGPAFAQLTPAQQQAQQLYLQATKAEAKKNVVEATRLMKKAVELAPQADPFLAYLAKLEFQTGHVSDAVGHGRDAVELKPANATYLGILMRGAFAGKDYETAKETAKKVVALGNAKVGATLVDEAKTVLNRADILNAEALFLTAKYSGSFDKVLAADAALKAAAKAEPGNKLHRERLTALAPLLAVAELDKHALDAPPEAEKSLDSLAAYLTKPAKTDREKVRVVYRWITDRIEYDAAGYFAKQLGDNTPEGVLKKRIGVCAGYANLFKQLASRAGLEVERVEGVAKGAGFQAGKAPISHAWNAVKVDGQWRLVDATWGAGSLEDKEFKKNYQEYYLFASPEQLIFTHFPRNEKWQLLDVPVTRGEFEAWPKIGRTVFEAFPGLTPAKVRTQISQKDFKDFPVVFGAPLPFRAIDAPTSGRVAAGKTYRFEIDAPGYSSVAIIVDGKPVGRFERKGTRFETRFTPPRGTFLVMGHRPEDPINRFSGLIEYRAE